MGNEYYSSDANTVLKKLNSSKKGLTAAEAGRRLKEFGYNEIERGKRITAFEIFLAQFKNALIILLVFAAILSMVLGEHVEAYAITFIIFLNAMLGFIQEYRAEKAIEALEKRSAPIAKVWRDGRERKIPAKELVPGDIISLEAGDIVPADSRLLEVSSLQIDEASLTGESVPSKKVVEAFKPGTVVADQENMAFMGTICTYGKARSIITQTGMKTEFGKIAHSLQATAPTKTPLQIKFSQLARQIGLIALVLIVLVFVLGRLQGVELGIMILTALTLTVSTVPNALPVIVTVGLSMGANMLAKKNMLIKKLPAAESLGAVTIICADKTGTLTKNEMTVTHIYSDNAITKVTGSGYTAEGKFFTEGRPADLKQIELLLRIGYLCNNAELTEKAGKNEIIGDPTEGSLIVLGEKGGLSKEKLEKDFTLVRELPFDSDRKRMSVIFRNSLNKKTEAYVKGAPDLMLEVCDSILIGGKARKLAKADKEKILKTNNAFAREALRVLGMAYKEVPAEKKYDIKNVEKGLIFVGLVGMIDPPREGVAEAVKKTKEAGINVMVITGDHALTAQAVAQEIGLFKKGDIVMTGAEVDKLSDVELRYRIKNVRIIARALPIQKSKIVDALQKNGHIVAMTGDGVNDAPALKKADVGIAMGITGTDVAKEVAEATLVDDNFATIVNAIEEGRNIYNKMIKSARYLLSCNTGEITSVLMAIILGFPLPLLPLQILLMNMLTDDFPALGLGLEKVEAGVMKGPPRNPKEKPITGRLFLSIVIFGLIMGLGTLFMFMQYKDTNLSKAQTMAFTTLVMFQLFAVVSSRTLHHSLGELNPFNNKWLFGAICLSVFIQLAVIYFAPLQAVFGTVSLAMMDWAKILLLALAGFVLMEVSKMFIAYHKKQ